MTGVASRSAAAWLCRRWVALYTRSLPEPQRQRRRAEIESDLYEHRVEAHDAGAGSWRLDAEILARVLVGVPADLSWRRATRQPHKRPNLGGITMSLSKSNTNRLLNVLGGAVVAFSWAPPVVLGALWLFGSVPETDASLQMRTFFIGVPLITSVALVIGLRIRSRSPQRGLRLIVAGVLGPVIWFWFLPIYAPVMIAIIALAVSATPRKKAGLAVT